MRSSAEARALAIGLALIAVGACTPQGPAPQPVGRSAPPSAVHTPPPEYPEALACNGVGGTVELRVRIEPDGRIRDTQVQRSSGNAELDGAAQKAVAGWTFNPALQSGKPVAQWISVPMTFHVPQPRPERCFALDAQQAEALKK